MTIEPADAAPFRERLLLSPGERQDIDYKSSRPFDSDDSFTLKLIRHILGMGNTGGGWLVIGYSQDGGNLVVDTSHDENTASTYEPTRLSQTANSYVARGQRIILNVYQEPHPTTGIRHPLIQVIGFAQAPYVCRSSKAAADTGEQILRQGAVYVRRPGAETSELSTAADWEEIISRCVRLRRDEFLGEFTELFERMMSPSQSTPSVSARMTDLLSQSRLRAFQGDDTRP